MKLKCHRCKKEWEYEGEKVPNEKYPQYVTCPRCRALVKIQKENQDNGRTKL